MQKILSGSVVFRAIASVWAFFGSQWRDSFFISRFTSQRFISADGAGSVFARVWRRIRLLLCCVFEKLRLTKLLKGSIFTKPYLWCVVTLFLAPLIPTMAALALTAFCFVSLLLAISCDRDYLTGTAPMNKFILLYAAVYFISIFTSVTVSGSLYGGLLTTFFILLAIAVQNSVHTKRGLDFLIYALVTSGAVVSAYGVYQYVFGAMVSASWVDSEMFSGVTRVYSTLANPNVLAEYLLLTIPFSVACVLTVKSATGRLFFICTTLAQVLCMLLTYARGGWLGIVLAAAIFLVMLDRRFILLWIAGIVGLYFVLPETVLSRFTSIGNISDTSTSFRVFIWLGTISMLRDYWFSGIGPGELAFNKIYPLYGYNSVATPHSHNVYLQVICDSGVCGIVLFIALLFSCLRMLATAVRNETDRASKIFQIAAISALAGFLLQGATDYSFYNYRVTLVFWAVIGMTALIAKRTTLK